MKYELTKKGLAEGGVYEGQWRGNKRSGEGRYLWTDGREYIGQWRDGGIHGYGCNKFTNGILYRGQWENGISQGFGKERYPVCTVLNQIEYDFEFHCSDFFYSFIIS